MTCAFTHTVTQPFLTPNITHPSPAALCAILPTLRENKGLLVSLCCTSGEDRTGTRLMLSLPASKPQSPHKGSLGISLREDHTETRLMLSLPAAAAKPHSPHKRSLGIILREEKARLMLSFPVCKSRSPPERPLGLIFWEDHIFRGSLQKINCPNCHLCINGLLGLARTWRNRKVSVPVLA